MPKYSKSHKTKKVEWKAAPDVKKRVSQLVSSVGLSWVRKTAIYCFRSKNSKTRAYARVWGLNRIWQKALGQHPAYIIEVISEKFDKLDTLNQDKVLLHELAHIPKTFSGALLPHRRRGKGTFTTKLKKIIREYKKTTNNL